MYPIEKKKKPNKLIRTIIEFGECSSFHGVKYMVCKENSIGEKIFWGFVVLAGFCGAVFMTLIFWNRFSSNPIRITIQSVHKQTSVIPFPGVTICTVVRQIPSKVQILLNSLIIPDNVTMEEVENAIPSLLGYNQPISVSMLDLMALDSVFRASRFTIENIFNSIEPSCSEILLKCKWEETIIPCDNLFVATPTRDGYCCSFNSKIGNPNLRKYRTLFYGPQMGLSVMLNPFTANISSSVSTLSSTGIKVLIHSPEDYPGTSSIEKMIGNGTETYIRILGTNLYSSDSVKSLAPEQRDCLFEDEKKMKYFPTYRDTNCGTECRMNKIISLCRCVPFLFPATEWPICKVTDIICLADNYDSIYRTTSKNDIQSNSTSNGNMSNKIICDCPSQCNDVFYAVQTSSIPLSNVMYTTSNFYKIDAKDNMAEKMIIHVYFGSPYQTEMLRDTITSTYYLLSSFGGVFSLFLGCSFISILEIIYFFCIRLFTK